MTARATASLSFIAIAACLLANACASSGAPGRNATPNSSANASEKAALPDSAPTDDSPNEQGYAQSPSRDERPSGGYESAAESTPGMAAPAPSPARKSSAAGSAYNAPSAADQSVASSRARGPTKPSAAPVMRETERPGLATQWGETRTSWVTTTTFNRDSNQPWSVLRIQYDDEAGVLARTGRRTYSDLATNLVETPSGFLSVQIVDGSGSPLAGLSQGARSFVVGHNGDRYSIRVTNHSNERFEVVTTVDGLDVIDGRAGSLSKRGYLIEAYSSLDIDGFRRSSDAVAAFRFGSVKDSYAARTGSDRNVGVIGVAVFREQNWVDERRLEENNRRDSADPFPSRYAPPPPPAPAPMIRNRE